VGCGARTLPGGGAGFVPAGVVPGVVSVGKFAVAALLPVLQSTLELPGVAIELPKNPVDSAIGLPLVFESPAYTRTTTRFMVAMLVSK
jgi:hypothetical protein